MLREFPLPDPGEGLTEAEILTWHVAVGDHVAVNQVLLEVETAKAAVELPSPWEGIVVDLLVQPGDVVAVGTPVVRIDESTAVPAAGTSPVLVGYGVRADGVPQRRPRSTPHGVAHLEPGPPGAAARPVRHGGLETARAVEDRLSSPAARDDKAASSAKRGGGDRAALPDPPSVLAKPPVRLLARERGVDLSGVQPTGPHGTITHDDVERAARSAGSAGTSVRIDVAYPPMPDPAPAPPDSGAQEIVPLTHVQRQMAAAMTRSAFTAPQVTVWRDADVTAMVNLIAKARGLPRAPAITPLTFAALALVRATRAYPIINASLTDDGASLRLHHSVNLGIAVSTQRGLIVPHVPAAEGLDLSGMAEALRRLIDAAREGRSSPHDLVGSTITITNIGVLGLDAGIPLLNPGELAILALGRVADRPWVIKGKVRVRKVVTLALSVDHRVIDGATAAAALTSVTDFLGDPVTALVLAR